MLSLHHIRQARSLREMSLSDRNTGGYYSRKSLSFLKPFLNQSTLIFSIDLKDSSFISFNSLPPKHLGDYPPMARQTHRSPAPSPRLSRPGLQASLRLLQVTPGLQEDEVTLRDREGQHVRTLVSMNSCVLVIWQQDSLSS